MEELHHAMAIELALFEEHANDFYGRKPQMSSTGDTAINVFSAATGVEHDLSVWILLWSGGYYGQGDSLGDSIEIIHPIRECDESH